MASWQTCHRLQIGAIQKISILGEDFRFEILKTPVVWSGVLAKFVETSSWFHQLVFRNKGISGQETS